MALVFWVGARRGKRTNANQTLNSAGRPASVPSCNVKEVDLDKLITANLTFQTDSLQQRQFLKKEVALY